MLSSTRDARRRSATSRETLSSSVDNPTTTSVLLEADLLRPRFLTLADAEAQDAVGQARLDLLGVGILGQREAAREAAVLALVHVERLAFPLLLGLARAADGEDAVLHRDVELLF